MWINAKKYTCKGTNELGGHQLLKESQHGQSAGDLCCSAQIKQIKQPNQRYIEEEYYSKYFNAFLLSTVQGTPPRERDTAETVRVKMISTEGP